MSDSQSEHVAPGLPGGHPGQFSASPPAGQPHGHADSHEGPSFQLYMYIFYALCVFTALSFVFNEGARHGIISHMTSVVLIVIVAVIKASCVGAIFMHLKFDWGKLYCIILPVCVVTVMMVIILSIDATLAWHVYPDSAVPTISR